MSFDEALPEGIGSVDPGIRVAVCFATKGRAALVEKTIERLRLQTLQPAAVVVSCTCSEDVGPLARAAGARVITGPAGASRQRNRILDSLPEDIDVVVFFDDDFVPHPTWLATVGAAFRDQPEVTGITGNVIADGITGPGLGFEEAVALLGTVDPAAFTWAVEGRTPYGCNMAFRRSAIGHLRFDERLVLYAWLEDRDFGGSVIREGGRLIQLGSAVGVHMGIKQGRISGFKFGYSQIVNPVYLMRKGTLPMGEMAAQIGRNVASNLVRSFAPEPFVDRLGRLRGNALGFFDVLRGRLNPERAEQL